LKHGAREIAHVAGETAIGKKAVDVKILDLRELTTITDYFVICSGDLDVHVKAISDAVVEALEKEKIKVWHIEGYSALKWVLLDYVDVVVHVFERQAREFYGLERLWGDAPGEVLGGEDPGTAQEEVPTD
jgi:ribosome-associated protein